MNEMAIRKGADHSTIRERTAGIAIQSIKKTVC